MIEACESFNACAKQYDDEYSRTGDVNAFLPCDDSIGIISKVFLYDRIYAISLVVNCLAILSLKKCEDYIACCSKLDTQTIVSIHQRRIKDDKGKLDGGIMEDIAKIRITFTA